MKRRAKLVFTREALNTLFFGDLPTKITGIHYDEDREMLNIYLTGPDLPECEEGTEPETLHLEIRFRGEEGKFLELEQ